MKHPIARVTDHAVLRYLERVLMIDVEAHRREIGHLVDRAVQHRASGLVIDGMVYKLAFDQGTPTVVTVRRAGTHNIRAGRKRSRR